MIELHQAIDRLDRALQGWLLPVERVPTVNAAGRILREDACSRFDLPPFDKSAMDGYALPEGDEREAYRVVETVAAGRVGTQPLGPGTAVKIMTGAPVPPGTGRVVMVEQTQQEGDRVRLLAPPGPVNVCRRGEDLAAGDLVLAAGARLAPRNLAGLISAGITSVAVARPLRVAILSTGDELCDDPERMAPGFIMDSNSPMLSALAHSAGFEVTTMAVLPDRREDTVEGIRQALDRADFVLLSGGVSMGEFDYVGAAFKELGLETLFDRVAVKPGKPVTIARGEQRLACGLPGNPVSVYLSFLLYVMRAAAHVSGRNPGPICPCRQPLASPFRRRKGARAEFVPAAWSPAGGVERIAYHGSGHLTALAGADGFFLVPQGVLELDAGSAVDFLPIGEVWP